MDSPITVTPHMLEGLRILRLHHYKGVLHYAKQIEQLEKRSKTLFAIAYPEKQQKLMDKAKSIHSYQMKCVQTLNDFFPVGDEAYRDLEKEQE